jgi:hypothetical protein
VLREAIETDWEAGENLECQSNHLLVVDTRERLDSEIFGGSVSFQTHELYGSVFLDCQIRRTVLTCCIPTIAIDCSSVSINHN